MWAFITDPQSAVQFVIMVSCIVMGLSHMLQPRMWADYFTDLHAQGARGVIARTFTLELWAVLLIVTLHQVWTWPGVVVTMYGYLLGAKIVLSVLAPQIGLRSMRMAAGGDHRFVLGGVMLLGVGAAAGAALFLTP